MYGIKEVARTSGRQVLPRRLLCLVTGHDVHAVLLGKGIHVGHVLLERPVATVRCTAAARAGLRPTAQGQVGLIVVSIVISVAAAILHTERQALADVYIGIAVQHQLQPLLVVLFGQGIGQRVRVVGGQLVGLLIAPRTVRVLGGHLGQLFQCRLDDVAVVDGVVLLSTREGALHTHLQPLANFRVGIDTGREAFEVGANGNTVLLQVTAANQILPGVITSAHRQLVVMHRGITEYLALPVGTVT